MKILKFINILFPRRVKDRYQIYILLILYIEIGTTKAAINYFRALFLFQSDFSHGVVSAPVLLLWGCQDPILDEELADASQQYCPNIQVKKIPNATHWINQDIPDIVNKYMEVFLNDNGFQQYTYDF